MDLKLLKPGQRVWILPEPQYRTPKARKGMFIGVEGRYAVVRLDKKLPARWWEWESTSIHFLSSEVFASKKEVNLAVARLQIRHKAREVKQMKAVLVQDQLNLIRTKRRIAIHEGLLRKYRAEKKQLA